MVDIDTPDHALCFVGGISYTRCVDTPYPYNPVGRLEVSMQYIVCLSVLSLLFAMPQGALCQVAPAAGKASVQHIEKEVTPLLKRFTNDVVPRLRESVLNKTAAVKRGVDRIKTKAQEAIAALRGGNLLQADQSLKRVAKDIERMDQANPVVREAKQEVTEIQRNLLRVRANGAVRKDAERIEKEIVQERTPLTEECKHELLKLPKKTLCFYLKTYIKKDRWPIVTELDEELERTLLNVCLPKMIKLRQQTQAVHALIKDVSNQPSYEKKFELTAAGSICDS